MIKFNILRASFRKWPKDIPDFVPFEFLISHENQAQINHGQSLNRLNERGGLSPSEMLRILEDRRWTTEEAPKRTDDESEYAEWLKVKNYLDKWEKEHGSNTTNKD